MRRFRFFVPVTGDTGVVAAESRKEAKTRISFMYDVDQDHVICAEDQQ